MRKIILSCCFCFIAFFFFVASAQLIKTKDFLMYDKIVGGDSVTVIVFDSITPSSKLSYTGGIVVNWYEFKDPNTSISNLNYIFRPDDATGYILDVDGKRKAIWIIDYSKHRPVPTLLEAEYSPKTQCENVKLNCSIADLSFKTLKGNTGILPRKFTITYTTLNWTDKWNSIDTTEIVSFVNNSVNVQSPRCNTIFTLKGDQYADSLGLTTVTMKSTLYTAVAVESHPSAIETNRTESNEANRPSISTPTPFSPVPTTPISGSAPLDFQFLSNANEPSTRYYLWEILKNGKPLVAPRIDKDQRYSFTEAGTYVVRMKASNDFCSSTDSISIVVSESAIQVPNVFTPNGDGINDEFRVAYKSIVRFHCWVYNRWGRNVFEWTDPQKGWDGTIGSAKAAPGPYFYVIEAYGSDVDAKGVPKKYLLKGDINLLRGKE